MKRLVLTAIMAVVVEGQAHAVNLNGIGAAVDGAHQAEQRAKIENAIKACNDKGDQASCSLAQILIDQYKQEQRARQADELNRKLDDLNRNVEGLRGCMSGLTPCLPSP